MLSEALDYPTAGDHGTKALLVGAALLAVTTVFGALSAVFPPFFGLALVGFVAVRGYYVRVLRAASDTTPEATAPSFGDTGPLLRDGATAIAIAFVYALPAAIFFLLAVGGNLASAVRDPTTIAIAEAFGGVATLFGLLYTIGMLYVLPAAVTAFAHEGSITAAFRIRSVFSGAFSEDYAVGWVLTFLLQLLLFPIAFAFYPVFVGFFIHFFLGVAIRYIWGASFGAAMGYEPDDVDVVGITPTSTPVAVDEFEPSSSPDYGEITPPTNPESSTPTEEQTEWDPASCDPLEEETER